MILKKKKRPAWDTKGRLEDMEELTAVLNEHLQTSSNNMKDLSNKLKSSEDQSMYQLDVDKLGHAFLDALKCVRLIG